MSHWIYYDGTEKYPYDQANPTTEAIATFGRALFEATAWLALARLYRIEALTNESRAYGGKYGMMTPLPYWTEHLLPYPKEPNDATKGE